MRPSALSILALLFASSAWPQASTGSISGTLRDVTGAVIPNGRVELSNTATNVAATTTTNEVGFYAFRGLIPGPYRVVVEVPGMEKFEGTLTLNVALSLVVDPVLKPGQTATSIEVTNVTPLITVDSAIVQRTMDNLRLDQLPVNTRALSTFTRMLPGSEGAQGGVTGRRMWGMPQLSQDWIVDGVAVIRP